jgi:hypothetical protein
LVAEEVEGHAKDLWNGNALDIAAQRGRHDVHGDVHQLRGWQ